MTLPRLHVITDDGVVARPDVEATARSLIAAHGAGIALHLRGHGTPVRRLHELADALAPVAAAAGALLVVNDRTDVALAADTGGVQLGRRSIPVQAVRRLVGPACRIGYSAHGADEAASAVENGADYVLVGAIWETPSHPGEPGSGVARVRETAAAVRAPVVAIGGVTPDRTREALEAGAWGVAAVRGVWGADDPVRAAGRYLEELETGTG